MLLCPGVRVAPGVRKLSAGVRDDNSMLTPSFKVALYLGEAPDAGLTLRACSLDSCQKKFARVPSCSARRGGTQKVSRGRCYEE